MIIYGSKATQIATESIAEKCPNCGTQNSIQMGVFQKYAHIFWIPLFPIGKTGVTQCSHCKQTLLKKEFNGALNESYENIKGQSKTPIWTFSGLALISVLVVWGVFSEKQNDEKNAKLIQTPQSGDVYEIKKDYKQYTLYKVESVSADTVFLLINQFETNKLSGLTDLKNKGDESYSQDIITMLKDDLKKLLDKGEIIDIDRK